MITTVPIDELAAIALALWQWQSPSTSRGGALMGVRRGCALSISTNNIAVDDTVPSSCSDFIEKSLANNASLDKQTLFKWYAYITTAWGCSSICCSFITKLIPMCKKSGITSVTLPDGRTVSLDDMWVFRVNYIPTTTRTITVRSTSNVQGIDLPHDAATFVSHDVLVVHKMGVYIDVSGGFFRGHLQPEYFYSRDSFFSSLPGRIHNYRLLEAIAVRKQICRFDDNLCHEMLANFISTKSLSVCHCCCSLRAQLQCSKCKKTLYCGRECQVHDWSYRHKTACVSLSHDR